MLLKYNRHYQLFTFQEVFCCFCVRRQKVIKKNPDSRAILWGLSYLGDLVSRLLLWFFKVAFSLIRGGSRGRVQGGSHPPPSPPNPEMTCGFLIQLVFCIKICLRHHAVSYAIPQGCTFSKETSRSALVNYNLGITLNLCGNQITEFCNSYDQAYYI